MRLLCFVLLLAIGFPEFAASGQTAPAPPVRTQLASTRFADVIEMPLFFRLYAIRLPAGEKVSYGGSNAMLYAVSGTAVVDAGGEKRSLAEGGGMFLPAAQEISAVAPGPEPAILLAFLLSPAPNQRRPVFDRPAVVQELARTPEPLAGLQPGPYEFSLTRLEVPSGTAAAPPHQAADAALFYVLAGSGAVTAEDKTEPQAQGAAQFEPAGWAAQWANSGDQPLVVVQAAMRRAKPPAQ